MATLRIKKTAEEKKKAVKPKKVPFKENKVVRSMIVAGLPVDPSKSYRGSPLSYRPEIVDFIIDKYKKVLEEHDIKFKAYATGRIKRTKDGTEYDETRSVPTVPPPLNRTLAECGVSYQMVNRWCNKRDEEGEYVYPELRNAIEFAKTVIASMLEEGGLTGLYNDRMAALLLNVHHGYVPATQQNIEENVNIQSYAYQKLDDIVRQKLAESKKIQEAVRLRNENGIYTTD